jgi:hypothetical protein
VLLNGVSCHRQEAFVRIGVGAEGVVLGDERAGVAARFGGGYREFRRTPASARLTGVVDGRLFVVYDEHDRVELLEAAEPEVLHDADERPVPLEFGAFVRWLGDVPWRFGEPGVCIVPSLSLAVTFEIGDDELVANDARAIIVSVGVKGYFGLQGG